MTASLSRVVLSCALSILGMHAAARADVDDDAEYLSEQVVAACHRVARMQPPAADLPNAEERKRLAKCDSTALYYALGVTRDVRDARLCAYLEVERQDGPALGAEILLVSIYANGEGIARNPELARHYACAMYHAPAELQNVIEHIDRLASDGKGPALVYCDEMTSGQMAGMCAGLEERSHQLQRKARFKAALSQLSPAAQRDFAKLAQAAAKFADAHARHEVDLTGTLRGAFTVQAQAEAEEEFAHLLEVLAAGRTPEHFGATAPAESERALQESYDKLKRDGVELTTIRGPEIRQVELRWISYRKAWLDFARVHLPNLKLDALGAYLADLRSYQLSHLPAPLSSGEGSSSN